MQLDEPKSTLIVGKSIEMPNKTKGWDGSSQKETFRLGPENETTLQREETTGRVHC